VPDRQEFIDALRPARDPLWATRHPLKSVLGVVHNVTSATRLFDVLPLLARDPRIQVFFSCTESSVFTAGTAQYLANHQVAVLDWQQATNTHFDLAVATSYGGTLERLDCPLITLPHGMGYNKLLGRPQTADRRPQTCLYSGYPPSG
jgi:hypothetical protein